MPRYAAGTGANGIRVSLTDAEKALVNGMNRSAAQLPRHANIAALHFDGQVLIDLLLIQSEYDNARGMR